MVSFFISIVNNKLEKKIHGSIQCLQLIKKKKTFTLSDQLELLNFNTIRGCMRESVFMYVYIYLCVI